MLLADFYLTNIIDKFCRISTIASLKSNGFMTFFQPFFYILRGGTLSSPPCHGAIRSLVHFIAKVYGQLSLIIHFYSCCAYFIVRGRFF